MTGDALLARPLRYEEVTWRTNVKQCNRHSLKMKLLVIALTFASGVAAAAPDIFVTSIEDGAESYTGRFVLKPDSVQHIAKLPGHLVSQFVFYPSEGDSSVVTAVVSGCAEHRGLVGFATGTDRATQEYLGTRGWNEGSGSVPDRLAAAVCLAEEDRQMKSTTP
jgi:hypothetical protein